MNRYVLYTLVLCSSLFTQCQKTGRTVLIEGLDYKGVFFKKDFSVTYPDGETEKAVYYVPGPFTEGWDPSLEDIHVAENNLKVYNTDSVGLKNLDLYFRQYIGYRDTLEENIIWINLVAIKNLEDELLKMPLLIDGGDSLVFSLSYRVSDSSFFNRRF